MQRCDSNTNYCAKDVFQLLCRCRLSSLRTSDLKRKVYTLGLSGLIVSWTQASITWEVSLNGRLSTMG